MRDGASGESVGFREQSLTGVSAATGLGDNRRLSSYRRQREQRACDSLNPVICRVLFRGIFLQERAIRFPKPFTLHERSST